MYLSTDLLRHSPDSRIHTPVSNMAPKIYVCIGIGTYSEDMSTVLFQRVWTCSSCKRSDLLQRI